MIQERGSLGAAVLVAEALSGCLEEDRGKKGAPVPFSGAGVSEMPAPPTGAMEEAQELGLAERGDFAVNHELGIGVGPQWVRPHFLSLRDACLNDKSLRCDLLEASASTGRGDGGVLSAYVEARVPHAAVAAFKARAAAALEGEDASEIEIRRDRTKSLNMARPIAETSRRGKHLEAYRARLEALVGRAESRVEDLIKIAGELSRVQAEIEALEGQRRDLSERVEAERVKVVFEALRPAVPAADPVLRVLSNAGRMFWQSMADAVSFLVRVAPWLLLAALLAGAVIGFVRLVRRL